MPADISYSVGDRISIDTGRQVVTEAVLGTDMWNEGETITPATYKYPIYEWNGFTWVATNEFTGENEKLSEAQGSTGHFASTSAVPKQIDTGGTDWGAANISKDDFIDSATGEPLPLWQVAQNLDPKFPGKSGNELMNEIRDMAPKYQAIAEKEKKEKGFAREALAKDVYGISKQAGKVGAQMRGAYGGMGTRMRGATMMGADIGKAFEGAQQAYGKDIYGIEEKAAAEYETDLAKFIKPGWMKTPEGGADIQAKGYWEQFREPEQPKLGELGSTMQIGMLPSFSAGPSIQSSPYSLKPGTESSIAPASTGLSKIVPEEESQMGQTLPGTSPWSLTGRAQYGGREGGYIYKDGSGIENNRRKTFLDLMNSLPDAGGS